MPRRLTTLFARLGAVWLLTLASAAADEGWIINQFRTRLDIQPDGVLAAREALDVDFRGLSRHGIFRDISYRFEFDNANIREYPISLTSVTSADGRPHRVQTSTEGALVRFKIGDPNRTVSGRETYRIAYRVQQALNGFADHDELYWNATGVWPVEMAAASAIVSAPAGAIERVDCFQGPAGSKESCSARLSGGEATFTATRSLSAGEQMTIVAFLKKGALPNPSPRLIARPVPPAPPGPGTFALAGVETLVLIAGVVALWWRVGRDRRYVSLHHSSGDAREEPVPIFGARPVAVEFAPPDRLRPAQVGLIIDESADTVDITATIIDLAVRGYVKITELPKEGWLGHKDWQIDRLKPADAALLGYERIVLDGLFATGSPCKLSALKNKFYKTLESAKTSLYKDGLERGWFPGRPNAVRAVTVLLGMLTMIAGIFLTISLKPWTSAGLLMLPLLPAGLLLAFVSRAMSRRTAKGTDVLHRVLGFARYMKTGETHQQAFAERAQIFTEFLPYAIAFKCVDQWARTFHDIDMQAATAGWYGGATFNAGTFASSFSGFSSSISTTLASTPGGHGGSGSGGSSGGGGGGGGGGSW